MSTHSEREAISALLSGIDQPVIYDLGAFGGEDSEWMREACGNDHHLNVMVEPDPRNCEIIRTYRRGEKTILFQGAVTDYVGTIEFNEAVDPRCDGQRCGSGSIRKPTKHVELFPEIEFPTPRVVPCWSLDYLAHVFGWDIDLLWIDVQGAERDVIAGGRCALGSTRYLFLEAEQVELYEGQALRAELLAMLPNFRVIGEFDYNLLLERS